MENMTEFGNDYVTGCEDMNTMIGGEVTSDSKNTSVPKENDAKRTKYTMRTLTSNIQPHQLKELAGEKFWHKFIIYQGAKYEKLELLQALEEAISPHFIVPVMFQKEELCMSFYTYGHDFLVPLSFLCVKKFQILVSRNNVYRTMLQVQVILNHTHENDMPIDFRRTLREAVARRYDKFTRTLDLTAFYLDPEVSKVVLWPIWNVKAFFYLVGIASSSIGAFENLILADNLLIQLFGLRLLKLKTLDLARNKISSMTNLKALKGMQIKELVLDGNPICSFYSDSGLYIDDVWSIIPTLRKLDGVCLIPQGLKCWRRNYIPVWSAGCLPLVNQFLEHYFTLFDSDYRKRLKGMYHTDAYFSLTCNYKIGKDESSANLSKYTQQSRNLLRMSDFTKSLMLLNQGVDDVIAALCRLPKTEHDPYSFTVDMPFYSEVIAMIVVSGVYREPDANNLKRAFSRTFILQKVDSKEYQLVNDMMIVNNVTARQNEESFKHPHSEALLTKLIFSAPEDMTDSDREQMTQIFSNLTDLNLSWARKCLQKSKWNIKEAVTVFMELLKMNKFPAIAFTPNKK